MSRGPRWILVVVVLALTAAAALAQPRGGGTPPGGTGTPPFIFNITDMLGDPSQAIGEYRQIIETVLLDFVGQNRAFVQANVDALPAALSSGLTRIVALALGLVALVFPARTKTRAFAFVGLVIGLVVAQLPVGDQFRELLLGDPDLRFLREPVVMTLAFAALGALAGMAFLLPMTFLWLSLAGALAGGAVVVTVFGAAPSPALLAVGVIGGFFLMAIAVSRARLLIPLALGAALVVFAIGVSPVFMLPLIVLGGFVAVTRTAVGRERLKRAALPTLELQEGKVDITSDTGRHLHEILPAMADDRDNPLIKR